MILNDDIHNYYEKLVVDYISEQGLDQGKDPDYMADLCCIILNQLPPRYIRYEVDMAFYLPQSERFEMQMKVEEAVRKAVEFLNNQS
ncbi:MAG: late competence development ComFB family protein [Alkalimonas sp.]|uniref:Late competence development ComFB family protein n=1 Tax=Alkalimonas delamerensis TaxID=265981 RepID=A0ABT9GM53_9GAMM|nr:late competence development ComFB family protein [Alkalimonas delamerensis]MCC5851603.1 late competence development ComFB family protein [Alkalimonas sp.]MDP4528043.1 late competence development ComFB family protein [Alkalimonas delamerensis]